MKKGMRHMSSVAYALNEIIEKPQRKLSKKEAEAILRNCGIIDNSNNIQPAYVKIIAPKGQKKDESSKH